MLINWEPGLTIVDPVVISNRLGNARDRMVFNPYEPTLTVNRWADCFGPSIILDWNVGIPASGKIVAAPFGGASFSGSVVFGFNFAGGHIKTYAGSWFAKPIKVWDGSSWNTKPLKFWNGTFWRITPY